MLWESSRGDIFGPGTHRGCLHEGTDRSTSCDYGARSDLCCLEARAITVNSENKRRQSYSPPKDALTAGAAVGEEQKDGSSRVSWEGWAHFVMI